MMPDDDEINISNACLNTTMMVVPVSEQNAPMHTLDSSSEARFSLYEWHVCKQGEAK